MLSSKVAAEFCSRGFTTPLAYESVSTVDQNLDLYLSALKYVSYEKRYQDEISETKANRPGPTI